MKGRFKAASGKNLEPLPFAKYGLIFIHADFFLY
jgi:hypothetical protein